MVEIVVNCEEKCICFKGLSPNEISINREIRSTIESRKSEYPNALNKMCGLCMTSKINRVALDEKMNEWLLK